MFIPAARLAVVVALAIPATASAAGESSITSAPPQFSNQTQATFTFASTEGDDVFECRFNPAAEFVACPSPYTTPDLPDGQHTLTVRANDPPGASGSPETTPSTYTWTIDLTPPNTALSEKPAAKTSDKNAKFVFSSSDPSATFLCSLNGVNPTPCTSP